MNTYFILLRQATLPKLRSFPLDQARCASLLQRMEIRFLDAYKIAGDFDAVCICQTENADAIRELVKELDGWEMISMVASHEWRLGTASLEGGDDYRLRLRHLPSAHNRLQGSNRTLAQMLDGVAKKTSIFIVRD